MLFITFNPGNQGRGKVLFMKGGLLHFDISHVGYIHGKTKLNDDQFHTIWLRLLNEKPYLSVDGKLEELIFESEKECHRLPNAGGSKWTIFCSQIRLKMTDFVVPFWTHGTSSLRHSFYISGYRVMVRLEKMIRTWIGSESPLRLRIIQRLLFYPLARG